MTPPVKPGEQVKICIQDLTHTGSGIGRYQGFAIFVPQVLPGETVRVQIKEVKKNYATGTCLALLSRSKDRISPPCIYFHECGGCQLQHLDYEAELDFKQSHLRKQLLKIAGVKEVLVKRPLGMQMPWHYRNKLQAHLQIQEGIPRIGFYKPKSHQLIEVESCLIQQQSNSRVLHEIKRFLNANLSTASAYVDVNDIYQVIARTSFYTGEVQLKLILGHQPLPEMQRFKEQLPAALPSLTGIEQAFTERKDGRKQNAKKSVSQVLYGDPYIKENLLEKTFKIAPDSFFQVNTVQAEHLCGKLLELLDPKPDEQVLDMYCGIGAITVLLSDYCGHAVGIERLPQAVEDAEANKRLNKCENVSFIKGKAEEVVHTRFIKAYKADTVILDPPRSGCEEKLIHALGNLNPKKIAYVSCDPATLARDIGRLQDYGYQLKVVQPVDMFPQTTHIESITLLSKK